MKLFLLKTANKLMDVLLKMLSAIPSSCPHGLKNVRRKRRYFWSKETVPICIDCEWELEQQRNATGW